MKKIIYLSMVSAFLGILVNCGFAQTPKAKEIVFYNWKDYTDKSVLKEFEKKFGIKVILKEYETRDMMLSEIQSAPEKFDVIVASDSVSVSILKQCRLLMELDLSKIPNHNFIRERFKNRSYDPENKYSITGVCWGTSGIAINTNFVPADTNSWAVLWNKKYKGKIALMDEYREAMTAVLKYSHFSLNSVDPKEIKIAEENAKLLRDNHVQFGDTFGNLEKVKSGELWIAQTYNGDVIYKAKDRKDIKYILPKEGFDIFADNFVISVDSRNREEAHQLINFLLEPRNAAQYATAFSYATTIDADAFIDKEVLSNPVIYPPQYLLQKGEIFSDLGEAESEYIRIFNLLKQRETQQ